MYPRPTLSQTSLHSVEMCIKYYMLYMICSFIFSLLSSRHVPYFVPKPRCAVTSFIHTRQRKT